MPEAFRLTIGLAIPVLLTFLLFIGIASAADPIQTTQKIVILDPGHGGHDTGHISASGLSEKNLVLTLAKKTARRLEARYNVFISRQDDRFVSLEERVFYANNKKADLFISLHFHNGPDDAVFLFYYDLPEDTKTFIKPEDSQIWSILALKQQANSIKAAQSLSHVFSTSGTSHTSHIMKAQISGLEGICMPAVLIEILSAAHLPIHSSKREIMLEKSAEEISRGIDRYFLHLSKGDDK